MSLTLAFDIYGTLIDTSGVFTKLSDMIGEPAAAVMKTWRQKQLEYSFRRGLMRRHTDFSVCTRDALIFSCETHNIHLSKKKINELLHEYTILPAFQDVRECLESCRNQDHKMYAFSNGSKSAVRQLLEHSGTLTLFDGIVSTEDVKTFKPSPDVYHHFTKTVGSQPSDTWLISGNSFDVTGARACGWKAVWVQRKDDNIFDPWEEKELEPTVTLQRLSELPNILSE